MNIHETDLQKISVEDLQRFVLSGDVTVLDVRVHPSEEQLAGAMRVNPNDIDESDVPQLDIPKDRLIVTYCT